MSRLVSTKELWPVLSGLFGLDGRAVTDIKITANCGDCVHIDSGEHLRNGEPRELGPMEQMLYESACNLRRMVDAVREYDEKTKSVYAEQTQRKLEDADKAVHGWRSDAAEWKRQYVELMEVHGETIDRLPRLIRWWYGI